MTYLYEKNLAQAFPYSVVMDKQTIQRLVMLLLHRNDIPALSSFAVQTGVDSPIGPKLWLSRVSIAYLMGCESLPPRIRTELQRESRRVQDELIMLRSQLEK